MENFRKWRRQGIQFVIAIILARLLSPAEYGLVSIIMIFITIANVMVQNGFSTALDAEKAIRMTRISRLCFISAL